MGQHGLPCDNVANHVVRLLLLHDIIAILTTLMVPGSPRKWNNRKRQPE
jgi:hypothetical protein